MLLPVLSSFLPLPPLSLSVCYLLFPFYLAYFFLFLFFFFKKNKKSGSLQNLPVFVVIFALFSGSWELLFALIFSTYFLR